MQLGNNVLTWNLVIIVSAIVIVGVFVAEFFLPEPVMSKERQRYTAQVRETKLETEEAKEQLVILTDALERFTYSGQAEAVTPKILEQVNQLAETKSVNVKSFRPQRIEPSEGLVKLPYVLQISGTYPNVVSFVRTIDEPSTLFSVYLLQVAAADGETDQVNATVGIVAFARPPEVKKERNGAKE